LALVGSVLLGAVVAAPAQAHEGHGHVLLYNEAPAGPWHDEAIAYGTPKIKAALEAKGMAVTVASDSSLFTDAGLAQFDAIIAFQINGDPWTAPEKAAMEKWMKAGGGIAAIHNATDMRGNYPWWDTMIGALMPGHSAADIPGVVRNEDVTHPSTKHFQGTDKVSRWLRNDEWYNFNRNVRGEAHVLQTMDESTYNPGGNAQGYDHPITWCKPYDGGRFWSTALGHFPKNYDEPEFMQQIVGGVEYVAGLADGDCGGTVWSNYERIPLDQNTSAPYAIDVADDGKVFYTELVRGQLRMYDPETQGVTTVLTLPVYSGGEDGLLGVALDPEFTTNGHIFLYRSAASPNDSSPDNFWSTVSRFTFKDGSVDAATEKVIIRIPARRLPDEPGHTGGALDIDDKGNLFIGVGDDVNPHSEPSGGYAPLSERAGTFHDARETSANTNDLRGKILRINPVDDPGAPGVGSSYEIPEGNLFPESQDAGRDKTLPEIYAMGFRNPFRFSIDSETGWLSMADYSPDNGTDAPATRGPAGIAEWNLIKSAGNYGWPLCMGGNHQGQNPNGEPFRDVDYGSTTPLNPPVVGAYFDCANPVNDSVRNTGLTELPPARAADMYYGYQRSSVGAIPQGGGLAPMGGPIYRYDEELESDTKFPESFDGKPFFYDWARNKMYNIQLKNPAAGQGSQVEKVNPFLPNIPFLAPIDSKFGPDGSMYVLDWGGGYGRDNPTSGLYRIDYISGSRSPIARIDAEPDSGQAPLEVAFDASGSTDPEDEALTYEWDFDGDGTTDETGVTASHVFEDQGVFNSRLTVTDPAGKTGTTTVPITVGNTRPVVDLETPPDGSFFDFGDEISWDVTITDPEEGEDVDPQAVEVQPALGHDDHAHPLNASRGLTGSHVTSIGGHAADENIFYAVDARYTDTGGAGGDNPLLGSDTSVIFPKLRQAEWFDAKSSTATLAPGRDAAGGGQVVVGKDGAWLNFEPVNFYRIDTFNLRVQAAAAGGTIELRKDSPTGEVVGTAEVPATGQHYRDVAVDVSDLGNETMDLYLVFTGTGDIKLNFFEAVGQGISPEAKPVVALTEPVDGAKLDPGAEVTVSADASDADGSIAKVEFFAGETKIGEATTAPYTVTWTAPDSEGLHDLTAKATDDDGNTTTSRLVQVQVGELFGDLLPFTNVNGEFERLGAGAFRISGAGTNAWQGVDQYTTLYKPGGGDDEYDAIVRVDASSLVNNSGKAGLIIRNDMTQPGVSPGYAMLAWRRAAGMEFLSDPDGNGQLNASTAGGTSTVPKWLKLSRRGDQVSAYWSNNGTTWTQVGTAVTLANIADTQDVGMFIMAHETAVRTADFSQFAIDSDPQEPEPEPETPSEPLSCVTGPVSDEFDSPALLPKWAMRHAPGAPVTQAGGTLRLPVTTGDINEASTGPVSFAGQPVPTGNWTATTKIELDHSSHWQWAGLVVHQSDNEYNKIGFVRRDNGTRFVEFQSETGGNRTTPAAPTLPADFPTTIHLRLTNTGGTLTGAYSADGTAWTTLAGSLALKTGTGAKIGLMAAGDLGTTPRVAQVDYLRVTPDATAPTFAADDEFDGTALNGCRWAESVRYNSHKESVADGHLKIDTEPGDINGANPIQPRNFILQDAPAGDWVAETRLKAPLKHQWQLAGLLMYGDDDNYAKADVVAYNAPGSALDLRAELAAEKGGSGVSGGDQIDIADTSESGYWHVRVTKTGTTYTAEVGHNTASLAPIGNGITYDGPLNSLGLMAIGPNQEEPVTVEFDYFHLDTEEEPPGDTTAPVTTAGQAVVGDGVRVTLTATDETGGSGVESTEYRVDEGDWTDYTAPFTITEPGEHTVEFRSTDVAGNEEATKSIEVVVEATDEDAPTTSITWVPGTADGEEGWYVTGPSFTLAADDDGSGVASTEYRLDGGAWTAYDGAVDVTDGEHTVEYRSTDEAGNVEETKSSQVKVDTVAPATGAVRDESSNGVDVVVLDPTDATSGVASTEYRIDGGDWTDYTDPVQVTGAGDHTVGFRSTDVAGNVEEEGSIDVTVDGSPDTTAPVTTVKTDPASPDGSAGWFTTAPKVTLNATDAGSGVVRTEYRIGNGAWTAYTAPFTITAQGRQVLEVRSVDKAGNVETAQSKDVAVDTVQPVADISGIRERTYPSHKTATVAWTATDATSGVRGVRATLDGEPVEAGEWAMWTLSTGRHVLTVTATDAAGNSSSRTVVFTVQATGKSLKKVVAAAAADDQVGPKLATKLLQADKDARKAERSGDRRAAKKELKQLRKLIRKKVEGELRAALLAQVRERLAKR
jgi:glucose/arabinose dehydrogenase/type 1 glutamine amidotransferase/regulation of enolase protein 1 (concanavalin A-like superfamily)